MNLGQKINVIESEVCSHFGISRQELLSRRRFNPLAEARGTVFSLIYGILNTSQEFIAEKYGYDRTSVLYMIHTYRKTDTTKKLFDKTRGIIMGKTK